MQAFLDNPAALLQQIWAEESWCQFWKINYCCIGNSPTYPLKSKQSWYGETSSASELLNTTITWSNKGTLNIPIHGKTCNTSKKARTNQCIASEHSPSSAYSGGSSLASEHCSSSASHTPSSAIKSTSKINYMIPPPIESISYWDLTETNHLF